MITFQNLKNHTYFFDLFLDNIAQIETHDRIRKYKHDFLA